MTSFLDIIDYEDQNSSRSVRQASVASKLRADKAYGQFIAKSGESALDYLDEELRGLVTAACDEFGVAEADREAVYASIIAEYRTAGKTSYTYTSSEGRTYETNARTASAIHESRKPKMCNFHSDVVDISLADGQARSGFDAMAQHWGGPKHCQGDGYEGGKCNFKPQMTTQSYWDTKAEKAEERRNERAEQQAVEQEVGTDVQPVTEEVSEETPQAVEPVSEPVADEGAEIIPFPVQEAAEPASEPEVPMSMAASTKTATGNCPHCGSPVDPMARVTGAPCPNCHQPIQQGFVQQARVWKVADGTPVQKMDKSHNLPGLPDTEDADSPHPTKRKDIVQPIKATNDQKIDEIGEQVTEHQDVTQDAKQIVGEGTKTFKGGPSTAVSSLRDDVDKNPITALMQGEFDGFIPSSTVQDAITASRRK